MVEGRGEGRGAATLFLHPPSFFYLSTLFFPPPEGGMQMKKKEPGVHVLVSAAPLPWLGTLTTAHIFPDFREKRVCGGGGGCRRASHSFPTPPITRVVVYGGGGWEMNGGEG
nr:hypothetical protein [Morchella crassipes]